MDANHILESLNEAQQQAIKSDAKHSLILAGAGSGKTRVITHKVAWLSSILDINPMSIMTVTFTNKAAREMRGRIEGILGEQLQTMWCGTFHGLFHRMLKMHWQEAGLIKSFAILDGDDQLRVIKRVMKEMNIDLDQWPPSQVQWFINKQKEEGRRKAKISSNNSYLEEKMAEIYESYQAVCEAEGLVDFSEILLRSYELLNNNEGLRDHYQRRFEYVLVDEFQDTNEIQYLLLRQIVGPDGCIMVVGDDDQSIYSWRGAKSGNIKRYTKDFPKAVVIKLEQNYRSTKNILSAANSVIKNNPSRMAKELWSNNEEGEMVKVYRAFNERDEAKFIVDIIKDWVKEGGCLSECAIIYRSNAQSRSLEDSILRAELPYRIYGGVRFYERAEIKNALAYARLAVDRNNDAAFERVINVPTRGIGAKTMDNLREAARQAGSSLWQAAEEMAKANSSGRAVSSFQTFIDLINKIATHKDTEELGSFFTDLIEASELKEFHGKEPGEKGRSRVENLEELITATSNYFGIGEDDTDERTTLELFLDQAALDAGETQADESEKAIQLMTLHSSKGLEFPLVFIAGCEEGLFPHQRSMDDAGQLAEERRLCYVGMTRAMQRLYMTHAEVRSLYGSDSFSPVSRFIKEIPEELKYEIRLAAEKEHPDQGFKPRIVGGTDVADTPFALGDRVTHNMFGEGIILNYEGQGDNARVEVNFDSGGSKWLVVSYANLEKV